MNEQQVSREMVLTNTDGFLVCMCRFLSAPEQEYVGRLCKLLIESGRLDFLQNKGFTSRLIRYVNSQVTLENMLLTAVPNTEETSSTVERF